MRVKMSDKVRIVIKSDEEEANIVKEKLNLKGYEVSISDATNVVFDGTDLGGHMDFLSDIDGKIYMIIGTK
jgi:hypothetical protein